MATLDNLQQPQTKVTSDERGLSTWLGWMVLLLFGLLAWALAFYQVKQEEGSLSSTLAVAGSLQGNAAVMQSEAILTAFGNAGSLDRLAQARARVQSDLSLLERGGYSNNSDKYPVLLEAGGLNSSLSNLNKSFSDVSIVLQPMLGAYDTLNQATTAETGIPRVVNSLRQLSASIAKSSRLTSSPWSAPLNPVRTDLTRSELDSLQALFTPSPAGSALASQWSDLIGNRAKEATQLAGIAAQDTSLSPAERQLIVDLSKQATLLSNYTKVLLASQDVRFQARNSLENIRKTSEVMQQNAQSLIGDIKALHRARSIWTYILWAGMGLTIVGLLGVLRSLWVMGYDRWRAQQDGHRGTILYGAIEKTTRELRKLLSLETNNEKIFQSSDSPIFPLVSMINQVLEQRQDASNLVEEQSRLMQKGVFDLDGASGQLINKTLEHKKIVQDLADHSQINSESLAVICQSFETVVNLCQKTLEISYKGGAVAQESSWKMQSLREKTQSTAKRIKRLGEGAQSISVSSDLIRDMTKKVKVLALNLAIEAANHGEEGKTFASLARELERLALAAEQSIKDIDNQIFVIQGDAKETVSSMENGIVDVVEIAKLSSESLSSFKDQDRSLERLRSNLEQMLNSLEGTALSVERGSVEAQSVSNEIDRQEEGVRDLRSKNDHFKGVLNSFRRWLNGMGRDI